MPSIHKTELQLTLEEYNEYTMFFTDESKTNDGVGVGVGLDGIQHK